MKPTGVAERLLGEPTGDPAGKKVLREATASIHTPHRPDPTTEPLQTKPLAADERPMTVTVGQLTKALAGLAALLVVWIIVGTGLFLVLGLLAALIGGAAILIRRTRRSDRFHDLNRPVSAKPLLLLLTLGALGLFVWSGEPVKLGIPGLAPLSCHLRGAAYISPEEAANDLLGRFPNGPGCYQP